jgi:broad specificity phosphatase PhoE
MRDSLTLFLLGQNDTVLNETGKEQVELVGNRLKYEHITRMYTSDLERALKVNNVSYALLKYIHE